MSYDNDPCVECNHDWDWHYRAKSDYRRWPCSIKACNCQRFRPRRWWTKLRRWIGQLRGKDRG